MLNRGRNPGRLPAGVRTIVADRTRPRRAGARRWPASACDALVDVTYAPTTGSRRRRAARRAGRTRGPRAVRLHRARLRSRAARSRSTRTRRASCTGASTPRTRSRARTPLLRRHREARPAGDDRASHPRLRPAEHAQQRDVLLRPAGARAPDPAARRGRLAPPVRSRRGPGRRHGRHARRAGRLRPELQRQRRGGHHPGRLRRADRRRDQAAAHARPRAHTGGRQAGRRSARTSSTTATPSTRRRACAPSWASARATRWPPAWPRPSSGTCAKAWTAARSTSPAEDALLRSLGA